MEEQAEIELARQELGDKLKRARKSLGMNQTVAARRAGITLVGVRRLEQGHTYSVDRLLEYVAFLGFELQLEPKA